MASNVGRTTSGGGDAASEAPGLVPAGAARKLCGMKMVALSGHTPDAREDLCRRRGRDCVGTPGPAKDWVGTARHAIAQVPRRVRILVSGYVVVATFLVGVLVARAGGAEQNAALLLGALLAAPLLIAWVGDRITGIKAFAVEVSLAEVTVPLQTDFSQAVMVIAETGSSVAPQLVETFRAVIRNSVSLIQVNLRNDDYWWSTRLFLVAALAEEYTSVRALVFVRGGEQRLYVGVAAPGAVRRSLATAFPQYETAYRNARVLSWARPAPTPDAEIFDILEYHWRRVLPDERAQHTIVSSAELRQWLGSGLDTEGLPYGPLSPLLRFRVLSRRQPYAGLVDGGRLVSVIDRDQVAVRSAVAELEHDLR